MLMYMYVSWNMHGIEMFSMNVPCMLHEYDMHVNCMSKMDGLHASINWECSHITCVAHTCSITIKYTYYYNIHATCMYYTLLAVKCFHNV